jgi:uncharacterized protein (DUF924 family)
MSPGFDLLRETDSILTFWFPYSLDDPEGIRQAMKRWFEPNEGLDREVTARFSGALARAAERNWDPRGLDDREILALILLFDQFPRNIHRGTSKAFTYDNKALSLAMRGIEAGRDQHLDYFERMFFCMPFQHAEDLAVQEVSVALFRGMVNAAPADMSDLGRSTAEFAELHQDIIQRFGRFPHRNEILGRESTPEEEAYLKKGGATFGQSS